MCLFTYFIKAIHPNCISHSKLFAYIQKYAGKINLSIVYNVKGAKNNKKNKIIVNSLKKHNKRVRNSI